MDRPSRCGAELMPETPSTAAISSPQTLMPKEMPRPAHRTLTTRAIQKGV